MKRILFVLVLIAVAIAGYFAFFDNGSVVELQDVPSDVTESYTIKMPVGWDIASSSFSYGGVESQTIFLRSPDYRKGVSGDYGSLESGIEILITKRQDQFGPTSVEELLANIQRSNPQSISWAPVRHHVIAREDAITYYWGWEGDPALVTHLFSERVLYTITMRAAGVDEIPKDFDSYLSIHQAVVDSFQLK